MKTKPWAIVLIIACTIFTSSAQLLYKSGAANLSFNLLALITNWPLILGMICYCIGAVLLIAALRGGEVTVLYPFLASSYVWVSIFSIFLFSEVINWARWTGIFLIVAGIITITFGDKKAEALS